VESFWTSESIRLEKEAIRYNAAKRGLAKLCVNSMWVNLTERNDRTVNKVITEPKEPYGFPATPSIEVMNPVFSNHDVVGVS